jgi:putative transposase
MDRRVRRTAHMARPLRINAPDLTYHVTARGTGRMPIYRDDQDRLTFLERLARVVEDCHLRCHAYCLMTNHYHLVVRTLDANLSRALQRLNGSYAQWWNGRHERSGHVFQGRFGAQVIQDDAYLLVACRYVVLNPVRAGLVDTPGDWIWSSYRATAALAPVPRFLSPDALWRCLSHGPTESAVEGYRQFVSADGADRSRLPSSPVVGSVEFVERFGSIRAQASREVPRRERQERPTLDGLFAGAITRTARDRCATAAFSAGYRMAEVARFLDVHPSTISKMIERHRLSGDGS